MDAVEPNLHALLIFAIVWTICCAGGFQIAGLFPLRLRDPQPGQLIPALTVMNAVLLIVLAGLVFAYSFKELRWTSLVVAGGSVFLFAPFATEDMPDKIKHGPFGLLALASVVIIALATLISMTGPSFSLTAH